MDNVVNFEMDDLVGNLFVTLKMSGYDVNRISYHLLDEYINILFLHLQYKRIQTSFKVSRDFKQHFLQNNKDLYLESDEKYIDFIGNMSLDELIEKYCGVLSTKVMGIMHSEAVMREVVAAYEFEFGKKESNEYIK